MKQVLAVYYWTDEQYGLGGAVLRPTESEAQAAIRELVLAHLREWNEGEKTLTDVEELYEDGSIRIRTGEIAK